jgi:hypothetical protein
MESIHHPNLYGKAAILCGSWVAQALDKGTDPQGLGNWSFHNICGEGTKHFTIIKSSFSWSHRPPDPTVRARAAPIRENPENHSARR